jgi:hypothetical protein
MVRKVLNVRDVRQELTIQYRQPPIFMQAFGGRRASERDILAAAFYWAYHVKKLIRSYICLTSASFVEILHWKQGH